MTQEPAQSRLSGPRNRGRRQLIGVAFFALSVILCALLVWTVLEPMLRFQWRASRLLGRTEGEVIQTLGKPKYILMKADLDTGTLDSPWKGMHFRPLPRWKVHNKVFLYQRIDRAAYVFIDERGMVEHVALAGT